MPAPSIVDLLRHIARGEPLPGTVRAFRGLTREHLGQLLEDAAGRLAGLPVGPQEPDSDVPVPHVHAGEARSPAPRAPRRAR